jgi:anion-transporting  ArsA/GET3 family ATPase
LREKGLRLLLFGGKGRVGKTTCAAALFLAQRHPARPVLLVSTDPAHSLADYFGGDYAPSPSPPPGGPPRQAIRFVSWDCQRSCAGWLQTLDAMLAKHRFFGLFLKYREVFRLPRISKELVKLSKRVKRFRRMVTDPEQAALVAVTIPAEMAYEETRDLVAGCERLGVGVPILFGNMATPVSCCPTCSTLRREEESVRGRYETVFASRHVALVFRREEPRGVERLRALGRALYVASGSSPEALPRKGRLQ